MRLKDFKVGDWFFNDEGRLVMMKEVKENDGHFWCSYSDGWCRTSAPGDMDAYPLTMHNKILAEQIRWYHDQFSKDDVLTPDSNRKLCSFLYELMMLNVDNANQEDYCEIFGRVKEYYEELKANKLKTMGA